MLNYATYFNIFLTLLLLLVVVIHATTITTTKQKKHKEPTKKEYIKNIIYAYDII